MNDRPSCMWLIKNNTVHLRTNKPYSIKLWREEILADLELQENWWRKFWQLITLITSSQELTTFDE